MEATLADFKTAYQQENGYAIAQVFTPVATTEDTTRLYNFHRGLNAITLENELRSKLIYRNDLGLSKAEGSAWKESFTTYWSALGDLLRAQDSISMNREREVDWTIVYQSWRKFAETIIQGFVGSHYPYWSVPLLPMAGKYLRNLALKADLSARSKSGDVTYSQGLEDDVVSSADRNENLQDAARMINRMFATCINDRSPVEESRKWGSYAVANLLFKTYFNLNALNLCKNLIRSFGAHSVDIPPLEMFPKAHQVTFNYYLGVVSFLEEDYVQAETYLQDAWKKCHPSSKKNQELILTYLIPCHLITSQQLPTAELLTPYPNLASVFLPLITSIKQASLSDFEDALQSGELYFVKRRIYLTLERARDICLRNLFRKVFLAGGYEPLKEGQTEADRVRKTRVTIDEFAAGVRISSSGGGRRPPNITDRDEVECLLANMIYKNYMKGYIHRERGIVVLSKTQPFPGTPL